MDEVEALPPEARVESTEDGGRPAGGAFQAPDSCAVTTQLFMERSPRLERPEGHFEPFRLDERETFPDELFGPAHSQSHSEDQEFRASLSVHSYLPPFPERAPAGAMPTPPTEIPGPARLPVSPSRSSPAPPAGGRRCLPRWNQAPRDSRARPRRRKLPGTRGGPKPGPECRRPSPPEP